MKKKILIPFSQQLLEKLEKILAVSTEGMNKHYQPIWPNWHLQKNISNNCGIHSLFKYPWNIHWDSPYSEHKTNLF